MVKETVACAPRERNGGECIALAGDFPGEVIHITLQNVYWIVGIAYMFIMTVVAIHNIKK